ncbi:SAM-dependent methyltransferase [Streptomyces massasporeus]|uniref:SAM-dependent methyltransferase n=1 Tax=Streptomyces massasporeus TaxID=67324 RepID=UPI0037015BA2
MGWLLQHGVCWGRQDGVGAAVERGRVPQGDVLDVASASVARMTDYLLGGKDHYAADREACEQLLEVVPTARGVTADAHRFLLRVTSLLAREHRVRQFVVFGTGLPTAVGVHHVAQAVDGRSHVVYADDDSLALVHCRALWEDWRRTLVMRAGPLQAQQLLLGPEVRRLITLDEPTAVMFVSVLHRIAQTAEAAEVLEQVAGMLAPGSFIAASHLVSEDAQVRGRADALYQQASAGRWGPVRPRAEIARYFGSLPLLTPGLVDVCQWRPGGDRMAAAGSWAWAEHGAVAFVR